MSILNLFSLENKVAIVTGASTGLGQGMAIGLAEAGADIVGVDYVESDETKALIEKLGKNYLSVKADLIKINPAGLQDIVDQTVKRFGKVDILVNNAGIIRREDSLNFSEKDWDEVMNINVKTVFFFSQVVAKQFVKQNTGGKIISIASMLSYQGGIRVPSYTASKSGVKGITMTMANEWAKYNINVNAIAPGYMATNNTAALRDDEKRAGEILERIPAGRWGTPR
ncbi:MAG: 2-dehydro-3-deoxy-D-gluconate 5-dehydrogenase KduD, partial [Acholeplasmataceae bacterium]|nr:2-dehydro-3-deoxy-D-gluconate 5-dehydrogenase KduD [Acholeplasmataceae bacterium]